MSAAASGAAERGAGGGAGRSAGRGAGRGAVGGDNGGACGGACGSERDRTHRNPCLRCGACCAVWRVDFAREEWAGDGGAVPHALAEPIGAGLCRMVGTDHAPPRCAALVGTIGVQAACAIHEWRPSPCRELGLRASAGMADDACTRARARHGLPALDGAA